MTRPIDSLGDPGPVPELPLRFSAAIRTQGRRPRSLNAAVDSVRGQTHEVAIQVVVHGSAEIADQVRSSLGSRVDEIEVHVVEGGGRSAPLNLAIDEATGDYLCFLDDDDLVTADWIAAFSRAANQAPGAIIRAVTASQNWTTEGGEEPVRAVGEKSTPFPDSFDLLAHMSLNQTPICSLAYPIAALRSLGLRFDETLAVYEDWDFLMRAAMPLGVVSIPDETSLYRRLDHGNADSAADVAEWNRSHAMVIDKLAGHPVILPAGDARRLAGTHFQLGARSRYETELEAANDAINALTKTPWAGPLAFARRAASALRRRTSTRQP